jgi:hypothetical protein
MVALWSIGDGSLTVIKRHKSSGACIQIVMNVLDLPANEGVEKPPQIAGVLLSLPRVVVKVEEV